MLTDSPSPFGGLGRALLSLDSATSYQLDPDQFGALVVGLALVVVLLAALVISSWRR